MAKKRGGQESQVVHALWQGVALCGLMQGAPNTWPDGHVWTRPSDRVHITCKPCKQRAAELKNV
jgi:hypothetical protein